MSSEVKFYNVIFPIWILLFLPQFWIIALLGNYAIDWLVLRYAMRRLQIEDIKGKVNKAIWKTWIAGFGADIIGAIGMVLPLCTVLDYHKEYPQWWEYLASDVLIAPFANFWTFTWVTVCVAIASVCIYYFNKKWCLKKLELSTEQSHKVSLTLAILTAPFLFYFPTGLVYGMLMNW